MAFLNRIGARLAVNTSRRLTMSVPVRSAAPAVFSRAELMTQWVEYFDSDICDYFYYRKGAQQVFYDDFVADPEVYRVSKITI